MAQQIGTTGEGDMVLMDIATYSRREEDLALAQRLSAIELARLSGTKDLSVEEFKNNMLEAISQGIHAPRDCVFVEDIQDCRQDSDKNAI